MTMARVVDLSDCFWQFVDDVTTMPYSKLIHTRGFVTLSDATGRVSLGFMVLGLTVESAAQCCSLNGVCRDDENQCFVFCDVTSLMHNSHMLVASQSQKQLLLRCLDKIISFVEVSELAVDLGRVC